MKDFMKEFSQVCVAFGEGMEMYDRTMKVLDFLSNNKGKEFSPTEIANALGYGFDTAYWGRIVCKDKVVKPLHWLLQMGLVGRNGYTEKVTIDIGYKKKIKDVKIINGVEYVGYIYTSTMDVDSTSYKWFVL